MKEESNQYAQIRDTINPWHMLGWLLFAQVMIAFVGRGLSPLGIFIGEDLLLTNTQIGLLPAALFFGQFLASIPSGIMVDRLGTRPMILALTSCLGLSFLFMSLTSSFVWMLLFIIAGGLGYGAMHPASNRGIIYWFELRNRGTAMGIKQMGVTVGSALSAFILVLLAENYGWRLVVFGASIFLLIAGVLSYSRYRDSQQAKLEQHRVSRLKEVKQSFFEMAKNRPLLLVSSGAVGLNAAQMSLNTYLIIYANQMLGIHIVFAGTLLVFSEIGGSLGRLGWGAISDRIFKGNRMIVLCMIALLSTVSAVIMGAFPSGVPFIYVALLSFVFGFCVSGFNGLWMNATTELVTLKHSGLASGFSMSIGSWGTILGPPLFGLMTDITGSFTAGWYGLSMILMFITVLFFGLHYVLQENKRIT
ncbi:MFS transporter [Salicibibacter kimchii]|uniref:MFS transporter n=1 Tax=Salicibibacter kimchii TaxID=2099786 RepID=A0A345BXM5_9BACI|nr:MFS transporter [Salicibibacter kimchii]AXF55706.1 MFS transporter [Salicibibacter kimchii]